MSRSRTGAPTGLASAQPYLAVGLLLAWGCASSPVLDSTGPSCVRTVLDPTPLWTAAAAWGSEGALYVVDPGLSGVLVFSASGALERTIQHAALAQLDYKNPMRIERTGDSLILGDRNGFRTLEPGLSASSADRADLADRLIPAGVKSLLLSDFALVDHGLVGYMDLKLEGEIWKRGFFRLDLTRAKVFSLLEFPLENREYESYYYYDRRPYVAVARGEIFILRLGEARGVFRVGRRGLKKVLDLDRFDGDPMGLFGWGGKLVLLSRKVASGGQSIEWYLSRLDPRRPAAMATLRVPVEATRLVLAPGDEQWAMIHESRNTDSRFNLGSGLLLVSSGALEEAWEKSMVTSGAPVPIPGCPLPAPVHRTSQP